MVRETEVLALFSSTILNSRKSDVPNTQEKMALLLSI